MSSEDGAANEAVSNTDTPLGATAVTLVVALYGTLWLLSGFSAIYGYSSPTFPTLVRPFVGLILLLTAVGLWDRARPAWALTLVLFGGILVWDFLWMATLTLNSAPLVPAFVVAYLVLERDLYLREHPT